MRKAVTPEEKLQVRNLLPHGTRLTFMNHAELRWQLGLNDWSNERMQRVLGRLQLDRYLKIVRTPEDASGHRSHMIVWPKKS